jgi:hypothetical protein
MPEFEAISLSSPVNPGLNGGDMPISSGSTVRIDHPCVIDLPKNGLITFRYTRGPVTATEAHAGQPARASAELQLLEICDCDGSDAERYGEDDREETENSVDRLFRQARGDQDEE